MFGYKIALLVPVTSRGSESNNFSETTLSTNLLKSLAATTKDNQHQITLFLGVDEGDRLYDGTGAMKGLKRLFQSLVPHIHLKIVRVAGAQQRIAMLWNELAQKAYTSAHDYFFVLSDDAILISDNWVDSLVNRLQGNRNFGVVSLYEHHKRAAAGSWPTFPGFHRTHVDIFGATEAFDTVFVNSYVDIWISDVYNVFNASFIVEQAAVRNIIGGEDMPRYQPFFPGWEAYVGAVERGRRIVAQFLGRHSVPTLEEFPPSVRAWCRQLASQDTITVLGDHVETESKGEWIFRWTPAQLAYGPEGFHYRDYCAQAHGCIVM